MRKRYITVLPAIVLAFSLMGCQGNGTTETEDTQADLTEAVCDTPAVTEEKEPETEGDVFTFTRENFPRMDGSTSLAPLGRAVASVLLGETEEEVDDLINFNKTTQSYRNLMDGECDLILASEPNAIVFDEMKENGFAYEIEAISTEALVFVVNASNPVDNLTTDQIRDIYSGKITNWKEVGGANQEIVPFQRNSGAGSQALMEKLVMGDTSMMEAPDALVSTDMGELMTAVRSYDNSANAIGYSVYYYANDMRMAEGLKIISVDGVEPSDESIRSGAYPHTNAYFCAIASAQPADSPARILYDWMVSEDGQALVAAEGYVSVTETK